jgi:hypothetical protein
MDIEWCDHAMGHRESHPINVVRGRLQNKRKKKGKKVKKIHKKEFGLT